MRAKYLIPALLLLCGAIVGTAIAVPRGGFGFGMFEELNLSEDQKVQLQALHGERREQRQARRDSGERPSPQEREALGEQFRAKLAEILTPEQLATLEAHRANRPERGHRGHRGHRGAGLDLSDAQKDQVKALRDIQREKMQALRDSGERPSRETMQARREEFRANFEAILTPEQLEKLAARKAEREAGGTTSSSTLQVAPASDGPATAIKEKTWGEIKREAQD